MSGPEIFCITAGGGKVYFCASVVAYEYLERSGNVVKTDGEIPSIGRIAERKEYKNRQ